MYLAEPEWIIEVDDKLQDDALFWRQHLVPLPCAEQDATPLPCVRERTCATCDEYFAALIQKVHNEGDGHVWINVCVLMRRVVCSSFASLTLPDVMRSNM